MAGVERTGWARKALGAVMRSAALACALAAGGAPALADNAGKPMTFEWATTFGDKPAIFADGDFTPQTPAAFRAFLTRSNYTPETRIYMNSLGGDLAAGMEVGRIIREAHLSTGVARNKPAGTAAATVDLHAYSRTYPGYCISACALAFLGGTSRIVQPGSTYGVHQVSMNCIERSAARARFPWVLLTNVTYCPELREALSLVQEASGAVVQYVQGMGANPVFLTEMSKAGPDAINPLSEEQLDAYHINFVMRTESWDYLTDTHGQFFLRHTQGDEWKEDRIEFFCDRSDGPRLFLWVVHDTRRSTGRADPREIVDLAARGLTILWQPAPTTEQPSTEVRTALVQPYEIIQPPQVTEFENVTFTIDVSQRFLDVLTSAQRFEISSTDPDPETGIPFSYASIELARDKIEGIIRACR
jgi:hypothetical protein